MHVWTLDRDKKFVQYALNVRKQHILGFQTFLNIFFKKNLSISFLKKPQNIKLSLNPSLNLSLIPIFKPSSLPSS